VVTRTAALFRRIPDARACRPCRRDLLIQHHGERAHLPLKGVWRTLGGMDRLEFANEGCPIDLRARFRPPQPRKPTRSCSRASAAVVGFAGSCSNGRRLTLAEERRIWAARSRSRRTRARLHARAFRHGAPARPELQRRRRSGSLDGVTHTPPTSPMRLAQSRC
jgi:hypothetical protein